MTFYENYVQLCNQINKSPSAVAIELKIGKPSVTRWKSGVKPRYATAMKVANYFGVTVEELMGESKGESIKKDPIPKDEAVSPAAQEILDFLDSASGEELADVIKYIRYLKSQRGQA